MSMQYAKELREKRAELAAKLHAMSALAKAEARSFTDEENAQFETIFAECDKIEADFLKIERAEKLRATDEQKAEVREHKGWVDTQIRAAGGVTFADHDLAFRGRLLDGTPLQSQKMRDAMEACGVRRGEKTFDIRMPTLPFSGSVLPKNKAEIRSAIREACNRAKNLVTTRATTAQSITTTGGGNLIGDDNSMIGSLFETILTGGAMRSVATVVQTETGATLPIPLDDVHDKGKILAINTTALTQDASFGQTTLGAKKYTSEMINLPIELIQDSAVDIQSWTARKCGERINRITEEHFATGAASLGEPEGMVTTGSSGGAAAGTTCTSEANIQVADLKSLIGKMDPGYLNGASWMMHQSSRTNIAGQLDGDGRPLWQPSMTAGDPDMLFGYPVVINNEYAAHIGSSANPAKLATFGRHDHYMIRDVMGVNVRVLNERFAELAQVAVVAFSRHDGQYINGAVTNTTNASVKLLTSAAS